MYLMSTKIKYPYHLVQESPWSLLILICICVLVILIILLDFFKCQYTYIHLTKEEEDIKFEIDLLIGEGFIDQAHRLAQEHHIDHWYWWDRIKENNPENTENKSSNNPEDNGDSDKNKKNGDSDKNNSSSNTDSKGERSRGGQGEMK